jgi:hypothetical protein
VDELVCPIAVFTLVLVQYCTDKAFLASEMSSWGSRDEGDRPIGMGHWQWHVRMLFFMEIAVI